MSGRLWRLLCVLPVASVALRLVVDALAAGRLADPIDLRVYHASAAWVSGAGTLYVDVPSEYPLAANLLFAAFRALTASAQHPFEAFYAAWVAASAIGFAWLAGEVVARAAPPRDWQPWALFVAAAAPATLHLALLRYDVYPAACTLLALLALRRSSLLSATWIGLAIALKGYALFMLPAFAAWVWRRESLGRAAVACVLAGLPLALSLLAVLAFAGPAGVLAPFAFHARRGFNGETSYDALNHLLGTALSAPDLGPLPLALQAASALAAAWLVATRRPESPAAPMAFALVGFIAFGGFHSPQYLLWLLPLVAFIGSRPLRLLILGYSLLGSFYLLFGADQSWGGFAEMVVAMTALRLAMMTELWRDSARGGEAPLAEARP